MRRLYDPERHEALLDVAWNPARVRDAVAALSRDVEVAFDRRRLWPLHPADRDPGDAPDAVMRGLYLGAAGMVHALDRLAQAGLHDPGLQLAQIAQDLQQAAAIPDEPGAGASLMVGATGVLLVGHRLAPSPAGADALADAIASNAEHESNELFVGAPGTMLAAQAMFARTREERFALLWRRSAQTLLARQEPDGLWTQRLAADSLRYVGAAHGFAGNVRALIGGSGWLDGEPAFSARAVATARALAIVEDGRASWPVLPTGSRHGWPPRVQWCHGAPGIVTSLAALAPGDEQHGALLGAGGELTWRAGPCGLSAGLCHGTAGNGFAFMALHTRTGDELWLHRARAFAMHALAQAARSRGRYSLFTGDIGAALLAGACLTGDSRFPGIDDL